VQHASSGEEGSTTVFFASASMDGTVRLWAGQTWACLRIFTAAAAHEHMPFLAAAMSLR
jgi:WD40 repeat protein